MASAATVIPAYEAEASVLLTVWKAVSTELTIFAATLLFAVLIRRFSSAPSSSKAPPGKAAKFVNTPPPTAEVVSEEPARARHHSGGAARHRNPAALLDDIVGSMRDQPSLRTASRALNVYHEELRVQLKTEGVRLQEVQRRSTYGPADLFTTLVHCAVRSGRYHLVEPLMDDMLEQGVSRPLSFYESAMKQLAGQKQYHLALAVYDRLASDGLRPSAVTCSCLVGFAAEVGELKRAVDFFESLSAMTVPSIRAYMTVLRVHGKRQDFTASVDILRDMEKRGVGLDSWALNVVLATGITADQLEGVAKLIEDVGAKNPRVPDVVSYNTLIKGYAQRGMPAGAIKALEQMQVKGVRPNAITFNTTMDACVRGGEVAQAWRLVDNMRGVGLTPDKFTCSILVKGLSKDPQARQVSDALALLREAEDLCESNLRSTLYHAVLEAAGRVGAAGAGAALQTRVLAQMKANRVTPSVVAQRNLIQAAEGENKQE